MPTITLEAIEIKQTELSKLIQQFKDQSKGSTIQTPSCTFELRPGERYAAAKLDAIGRHLHHVIVLAQRPMKNQGWQDSQDWAISCGGEVASPEEYALIKANCADLLTESVYWTNKEYKGNASYAWFFDSNGSTSYDHKSAAFSALAVRRV